MDPPPEWKFPLFFQPFPYGFLNLHFEENRRVFVIFKKHLCEQPSMNDKVNSLSNYKTVCWTTQNFDTPLLSHFKTKTQLPETGCAH